MNIDELPDRIEQRRKTAAVISASVVERDPDAGTVRQSPSPVIHHAPSASALAACR